MKKLKTLIETFLLFFKIGLFTFGGGYAMISIFEEEFCSKRKYITGSEFLEMIALAESSPGPIAINSATYIGYKRAGFLGSLFATLGVVMPSFLIIYLISLFFDQFMQFTIVQKAFNGIKCGVGVLILNAGIKMFKKVPKNVLNYVCFFVTLVGMLLVSLFAINFSAVYVILFGGALGVFITVINGKKEKNLSENTAVNSALESKNEQKGDE
ncbi:MAG: chromate transporter [Clostridia bacterium]|nr:chromate transporter [Clostridia bacterium]